MPKVIMQHSKKFVPNKTLIAMVHVPALSGTPKNTKNPNQIIEEAVNEALLYKSLGIEALCIENMHDVPYLNQKVGPEITALMSVVAYEIKKQTQLITGIQILAGANGEALAAAHAAQIDFIRAEGFVFSHVADEGLMNSCAGDLLRYRKQIGAENLAIFTDIKKKHSSHAITADVGIQEMAEAAEYFLSDGIIVTGSSTGKPTYINDLEQVRNKISLPVIIGSGITQTNLNTYFPLADAFIVGSWFKENGLWSNPIDKQSVEQFLKVFHQMK